MVEFFGDQGLKRPRLHFLEEFGELRTLVKLMGEDVMDDASHHQIDFRSESLGMAAKYSLRTSLCWNAP